MSKENGAQITMKSINKPATIAVFGLLLCAGVFAADFGDWLEIHGYGDWAYAETDGNRYLIASADGEEENVQFGLNLTATPHERLTIVAQFDFTKDLTLEDDEFELDYAFAEWKFSDRFKARFGRIKHPMGIYGEVFEIGTIRPFFLLPQGIYGPQGVVAEAYNGIGATGTFFGEAWGLKYDVYGGKIKGEAGTPGVFLGPDFLLDPWVVEDFEVDDVIGAKLEILTPVPGWAFGVSGYRGHQETFFFSFFGQIDYQARGIFSEYVDQHWDVRAEWVAYDQDTIIETESYYIEVARRFAEHWQVGLRVDVWDGELLLPDLGAQFPGIETVLLSEDVGLSLNYWFTPDFVMRLEYHQIEGNRFAFPEDPAEILDFLSGGMLDDQTEMILFGIQFSF